MDDSKLTIRDAIETGAGSRGRVDASVIVCSYNRAESLRETLNALCKIECPSEVSLEVVVVDNNSSDHTRQTVEEMQKAWPLLRYVFERRQGLSYARNRGINVSLGDVILFTDDDVIPERDWVIKILDGMKNHNACACGGFIAPIWEAPPPSWLTERFYGFLAVRTDRDDDHIIESSSQAPYGANMAFRREVFDKIGVFDVSRGRKGESLASGEDGELFDRILAYGMKAVFLGDARVHHKVEAFRGTKQYMRRWRYQTSRNIAISKGVSGNKRLFNIPLYMFPQTWRAIARAMYARATCSESEAFGREIIVCHFFGTLHGLWEGRDRAKTINKSGKSVRTALEEHQSRRNI
jgi:glucosyl-dolichyl phosphate glucuronosyltransferase